MPVSYGPLGPRGSERTPDFLRAWLLKSARFGPSRANLRAFGGSTGRDEMEERYAGKDRQRREREAFDAAMRAQEAEGGRSERELGLKERSLEEQIRDRLMGRQTEGRRLGLEEAQYGSGVEQFQAQQGLAERSLEERIRAAKTGEETGQFRAETERMGLGLTPKLTPEDRQQAVAIMETPGSTFRQVVEAARQLGEAVPQQAIARHLMANRKIILGSMTKNPDAVRRWIASEFAGIDPKEIMSAFRMLVESVPVGSQQKSMLLSRFLQALPIAERVE